MMNAVTRTLLPTLSLLLPAVALARDPGVTLHVDPSIKDCSVRFAPELTQGAFHRFAREFGSVSAFKQGASPEPLGRWGVSADVEAIFFSIDENAPAWNDTFVHPGPDHDLGSSKTFPKLRLRVGVADDVDVGAFYASNPNANYGWLGLDVKYAVLRQGDGVPLSLSVRAAYTKTLYVADMNMHAVGGDVTIGRTFWKVLTPYLGAGADAVIARETSPAVELTSERIVVPHVTGGLEARWWHLAIGAEVQVAALTSYQAQLSVLF